MLLLIRSLTKIVVVLLILIGKERETYREGRMHRHFYLSFATVIKEKVQFCKRIMLYFTISKGKITLCAFNTCKISF